MVGREVGDGVIGVYVGSARMRIQTKNAEAIIVLFRTVYTRMVKPISSAVEQFKFDRYLHSRILFTSNPLFFNSHAVVGSEVGDGVVGAYVGSARM